MCKIKMKNLFEWLTCTLSTIEGSTSMLEDSSVEIIQTEHKERKAKKQRL